MKKDITEQAVKLNKQVVLYDISGGGDHHHHHHDTFTSGGMDDNIVVDCRKLHRQQLAASIIPETNCVSDTDDVPTRDSFFSRDGVPPMNTCDRGSEVEVIIESTPNVEHNGESAINKTAPSLSTVRNNAPCENVISSSTQAMR